MHDLLDFDTVAPDSWISNENEYRDKLLKLNNLHQVPTYSNDLLPKTPVFLQYDI